LNLAQENEAGCVSPREFIKRVIASGAVASAFTTAVRDDALKARGVIAFTLNCATIGSQLIDNLNASIQVRAVLTDLFLADQALRHTT
jgi:hypothetical protein